MLGLIADILLWGGVFFMAVTALGLIRLPDFYTRAHAVSKTETLGIGLILLGLALHAGVGLLSIKLALVLVFAFMANPLAANLLTRAALRSGVEIWTKSDTVPEVDTKEGEDN